MTNEFFLNTNRLPQDVVMREWTIMAHSIDADGILLNVTQTWADRLKYKPRDLIGRKSVDFLTPQSRLLAETKYLPEFFESGSLSSVRYDFVDGDGDVVPVIMHAQAEGKDGKFDRSIAFMFDNGVMQRARELAGILSDLLDKKPEEIGATLSNIDKNLAELRQLIK